MDSDEITDRVAWLARRFGVAAPLVVLGTVPEYSTAAVLRWGTASPARTLPVPSGSERGSSAGARIPTLTIEPARLRRLAPAVRDGTLAFPLAGLALDQPGRSQRRVLVMGLAGAAICVAAYLWSSLALVELIAVALPAFIVVALTVELFAARRFTYQADRRVAELLGTPTMIATLEHLREHPPNVTGWRAMLARAAPSPARRLARLRRGTPGRSRR